MTEEQQDELKKIYSVDRYEYSIISKSYKGITA